MNDISKKIRRYVKDILKLDLSGAALHIVIADNNVDDSSLAYCLSLINSKKSLALSDIMCKHCAELLLKVPLEKRLGIISDCSHDEYIFLKDDIVYSEKFNSIGTVTKNSENSNDGLYVKFKITNQSQETDLIKDLIDTDGNIEIYDDEICLV